MEDKEKQNIRIILNKWLKKQMKITDPDGKFRGYMITKSQVEKLKTKLWRNEECQQESKSEPELLIEGEPATKENVDEFLKPEKEKEK